MKKILLFAFTGIIASTSIAQTAVNFNVNDCSGSNHDLFTELNAGKVVVIAFVMPCTSCIGPSLSAYTEVQNYASSNPGRVVFYLSDDVGTTTCSTLTTWANSNGMTSPNAIFSNAAVKESDYGTGGMPKIVVLAGPSHNVLYTENGSLNVTNFDNAINQGLVAGIFENAKSDLQLKLFPNPISTDKSHLSYTLPEMEDVNIKIYNSVGALVKNFPLGEQSTGKHEIILSDFDSFESGTYYFSIIAGKSSQSIKLSVTH